MINGKDHLPVLDLRENLKLLNKRRRELFQLLESNGTAIIDSLTKIYDQTIGVMPGSIVEHEGLQFRVVDVIVRVEHDPKGKPWVIGNPQNRTGQGWSTTTKNLLSDWEIILK